MTETYYPVQGRITVYSYNDHAKPLRITATALTDLEGSVRISYWQINEARTEVTLTILQDGAERIFIFPREIKEAALPRPGRSFRWSEFARCWIHNKTGVRVVNA